MKYWVVLFLENNNAAELTYFKEVFDVVLPWNLLTMLEQTDKVDKKLVNVERRHLLTLKEELPGWRKITKGVPQRSTLRLV